MTTRHATAAKAIRQELKVAFPSIKFTVRSSSFAGGSSVDIGMEGQTHETYKKVTELVKKYEYGHFNGMEDIYEYSNMREDIPQVKYVQVSNSVTDEQREEYFQILKNKVAGGEDFKETYKETGDVYVSAWDTYLSAMIYRVHTGSLQLL